MAFMLAKNKSRCVQISGKILELLLLTVGLISTVLVMKEALVPYYSTDFVFSSFMGLWGLIIRSSPPSIIIAINLMVLLIFASSTFYCRPEADSQHHLHTLILDVDDEYLQINCDLPPRDVVEITPVAAPVQRGGRYINDDVSEVPETRPPSQLPSPRPHPRQKWKDIPTNGNEDDDTMEATWEAITGQGSRGGGKHKTKKKQVKKQSQSRTETTWGDVDPPQVRRLDSEEVVPSSPKWKELRKAETFNDAVSLARRGGLIRKVPSMSLEDFNQKVEAFIHTIKHHTNKPNRNFFDIINRKCH